LKDNNDSIKILYLPKASPEFNAVEESWRQGKYDLLASKHYSRFADLKSAVSRYCRTKCLNLDIVKYLLRKMN
jgi:transposase